MSQQSDHDGWTIVSSCRESNPADWMPGQPNVFALHGFAEFHRPHQFPPGYSSTARINYPDSGEVYFFSSNKGHERIGTELKAAINKLKKTSTE